MRLTILSVGRQGKTPEQALCDFYLAEAEGFARKLGFHAPTLVTIDASRGATPDVRMTDEAKKLQARLPIGAYRIALDERGRARSSEEFAAHLAALRDRSLGDLVFLVGGPDGLDGAFRDEAEERFALGPQTWPHLLARAMLAEQIFRAVTILAGHPYHRGRI